jgi:PTH1 family peptidyl-tRNA hydrolase
LRLIVGLGNPGARYARTRHNLGALAIERASVRWRLPLKHRDPGRMAEGRAGDERFVLVVPEAWMNESGPAVERLLQAYAGSPEDLIIVHDDLDLDFGRLRIKRKGGTGGHNGLLSIITTLNTDEFARVKIGIGRPAPGLDAAEFVLSEFLPEEQSGLESLLDRAVEALDCLIREGIAAAMNRFNVREREENDSPGL